MRGTGREIRRSRGRGIMRGRWREGKGDAEGEG